MQLSDKILEATDGGLSIILHYYPQAQQSVENRLKKFKIRGNEKTASASLKKADDGNWLVTDFGGDQKPRNGILVCMLEENIEFTDALKLLADRYGLNDDGKTTYEKNRPQYEMRPAEEGDNEGDFKYELRDAFTAAELNTWGKFVTEDILRKYDWHAAASVAYVKKHKETKELVRHTFIAHDDYPIFLNIQEDKEKGRWIKKYEPKAINKADRFRYHGGRPKNFIHGMKQLRNLHKKHTANEDNESAKLEEVILCSGDRDAINVAAATGFPVLWLNSESDKLTGMAYGEITRMTNKFYNIPDLDHTGQVQGHQLAMQYLDMYTIELPKSLLDRKDWRGNPCKDVTDFFNFYKAWDFKQLLKIALPYRLWDEVPKENYIDYKVNPLQLINFLEKNGFYRFKQLNNKNGYIYIKITDNVVEEIETVYIKAFIQQFLKDRKMPIGLRNTFLRANHFLSDNNLNNLEEIEIDFTDYEKEAQYLFFENKTWRVGKDDITEFKPGEVKKYVWKDEVIETRVKKLDPPFEVTWDDEAERYSIKIHNKDCLFFQYLMNTSNIHWQKEQYEGVELTAIEREENEAHLINKIYALGYLLHRYKNPNRPWCVFAMDNKISDIGESHGGSGKSIAMKSIRYFMKSITLEGRNPKLTENTHIWGNVTPHTDFVLVDDANQYLKFDFFFSALTGEMTPNPKFGQQYEIPFEDVPKFAITSNFAIRDNDPSTERRLLYMVFSDYYHHNKDGEYRESRSPYDDFKKNLFFDFTHDEWNMFYNTMAHCLKTYLNFGKIDPPMENVSKRNLITVMTDPFKDWADVYFAKESGRLNTEVCRTSAIDDFLMASKMKNWSTQRFTKAIKAWCKFYNYTFNPEDVVNEQGRLLKKVDNITKEHIYIRAAHIDFNHKSTDSDLPFPSTPTESNKF